MNKNVVGAGQRIMGFIFTWISIVGIVGIVLNPILLVTKGTTVGGLLIGYTYNRKDGDGFVAVILGMLVYLMLLSLTATLLGWVDLILFLDRDGQTLWEKWFKIRKNNTKGLLA